jgi:GNAT superfamily N-acetyltransferase
MAVTIAHWPDAAAFLKRAESFLLADEARHTLAYGSATTLLGSPARTARSPGAPFFATVDDGERVVATATRQPPYGLVVSPSSDQAAAGAWPWLAPLIAVVLRACPDLSRVQAPPELVRAFTAAWERMTGRAGKPTMSLRLHVLDDVRPLPAVHGELRRATAAESDLVLAWLEALRTEALPHDPPIDAERIVTVRLAETADPFRALYLWVAPESEPESGARAICGASGPTPGTVRINAVYTPPAYRRRGYATAAVAELSRRVLATGRRCVLFTDMTNPTSNRIYAEIGYRPVCDVEEIAFAPPVVESTPNSA